MALEHEFRPTSISDSDLQQRINAVASFKSIEELRIASGLSNDVFSATKRFSQRRRNRRLGRMMGR